MYRADVRSCNVTTLRRIRIICTYSGGVAETATKQSITRTYTWYSSTLVTATGTYGRANGRTNRASCCRCQNVDLSACRCLMEKSKMTRTMIPKYAELRVGGSEAHSHDHNYQVGMSIHYYEFFTARFTSIHYSLQYEYSLRVLTKATYGRRTAAANYTTAAAVL